MPHQLEDRLNVVISTKWQSIQDKRKKNDYGSVKLAFPSFKLGLSSVAILKPTKCWVIGGATLYKQAIEHPDCEELILTHIDKSFKCDTFFPEYNARFKFDVELMSGRDPESKINYRVMRYVPNEL